MSDNLLTQLTNLRQLFAEAAPTDPKVINDYAWTIVKSLFQHTSELNSLTSRQLLADCLKLPIDRPSKLYSALLSAAVKVSATYPDFRFAAFLNLWGLQNLRPEDHQRQHSPATSNGASIGSSSTQATIPAGSPAGYSSSLPAASPAGKSFPSLVEKTARALAHSLLLHPEDRPSPLITSSPLITPSVLITSSPLITPSALITSSAPLCSQRRVAESSLPVPAAFPSAITSLLSTYGLSIHPLLVTRIKQVTGKDGRKYTFVTLTSPEGLEIETTSHSLQPSPLHPLPEGKRHYVNIGQLYDCLLRQKPAPVPAASAEVSQATVPVASSSALSATVPAGSPAGLSSSSMSLSLNAAYLSQTVPTTIFPTEIGYLESIDQQHGHMHVFDAHSRHFVAPILRFSKERVGDFVRFIPIIPATSKFKTAIILATVPSSALLASVPSPSPLALHATVPDGSPSAYSATVPSDSSEGQSTLREIRITSINKEKGYAAWELIDKTHPITELLSPLQLSLGETSPTFTSGYLNLTTLGNASAPANNTPVPAGSPVGSQTSVPVGSPSGFAVGQTLHAFIYLRRGKDRQKRPHIARLFCPSPMQMLFDCIENDRR